MRFNSSTDCQYDPDGTYCYDHSIYEDEHDKDLFNTRVQREHIVGAIRELIDYIEDDDEFDLAEIHVKADKPHSVLRERNNEIVACTCTLTLMVYATNAEGKAYKYAWYIEFDGRTNVDGY